MTRRRFRTLGLRLGESFIFQMTSAGIRSFSKCIDLAALNN